MASKSEIAVKTVFKRQVDTVCLEVISPILVRARPKKKKKKKPNK